MFSTSNRRTGPILTRLLPPLTRRRPWKSAPAAGSPPPAFYKYPRPTQPRGSDPHHPAIRAIPLLPLNPNPRSDPCRPRGAIPARGMVVVAAAAAAAEEGSAARRFWKRSEREAVFIAYTPFVVSLAAGRLDLEAFRQCVAQNVHFLRAFAQAYDIAEECADDDDAKAMIHELKKAVSEELKMHSTVLEEWGIDPTKAIAPNPATVKYTDFLVATAAGKVEGGKGAGKIVTPFEKTKIAAYTVGAMAPFMRLHAFLGKELQMFRVDEYGHFYKKWINNYSSKSFEAMVVQIEELLDKLCVPLTGEELDVIEKLYHQAMKLKLEFFSAQLAVQPSVVPLPRLHDPANHFVIFCDFDLTCTVVDSSAILAEIAILKASKADDNAADNLISRKSSSDMRNSWNALSRQYTEEYEQCIESLLPKEGAKAFNFEGLYKGLEQLSNFEKQANARVVESGMLSGMNLEDIKRAGERLILQDGCTDFFQKVVKKKKELNADLHILSYCWCADLIRSAFSSVGCLHELSIHTNEFSYVNSVSTGEISGTMESPLDKVAVFKKVLNNSTSSSSGSGKVLSVYIGDTVGDVLCLLEADVGIVIGSSASLRTVGTHFGASFVPLFPGLVNKQKQLAEAAADSSIWKRSSGVLYTVSSWSEIQAFLLGA